MGEICDHLTTLKYNLNWGYGTVEGHSNSAPISFTLSFLI